jgi:RNA polymerase sigma-70 factor (ECF subfamily)
LLPLPEQNRSLWDSGLIAEGQGIVRRCLRRNAPGPYQIQAAINAVHTDAPSADATDWRQILALYDQLTVFDRSPVVELNRAVALAEVQDVTTALASIDALPLDSYYLLHAVRADFLRRLGRAEQAAAEYDAALELTDNEAERAFLRKARTGVGAPVTDSGPT